MTHKQIGNLRFIALSATLPNLDDIAKWLNVKNTGLKKFGDEYRPIKLEKYVLCYKNKGNPF